MSCFLINFLIILNFYNKILRSCGSLFLIGSVKTLYIKIKTKHIIIIVNPIIIHIYINNNNKMGTKMSSRSHALFSLTYYAFTIIRNFSSARHWTIYLFHRYDSILLRSCNSLRHWRTLLHCVLIIRFDIINLVFVITIAVRKFNYRSCLFCIYSS